MSKMKTYSRDQSKSSDLWDQVVGSKVVTSTATANKPIRAAAAAATAASTAATATKRTKRVVAAVGASSNKKSKETTMDTAAAAAAKTVKLFENSDSSETGSSSSSSSNDNISSSKLVNNQKEENTMTLKTRSATSSRSNSTNSNNNNNASVSATASAIVNSANSTQALGGGGGGDADGSESTLDDQPVVPASSAPNKPKSIMKPSKSTSTTHSLTDTVGETSDQPNGGGGKKRSVKIMSDISNKPDDILSNLKPDNKTKYKASTSTPSGLRRKPLKAPTDVSFIMKP